MRNRYVELAMLDLNFDRCAVRVECSSNLRFIVTRMGLRDDTSGELTVVDQKHSQDYAEAMDTLPRWGVSRGQAMALLSLAHLAWNEDHMSDMYSAGVEQAKEEAIRDYIGPGT